MNIIGKRLSFRASSALLVFTLLLSSSFSLIVQTSNVSAVDPNTFNAGRIIDDGIFTNKTTMGWEQIQRFLNGKGANCQNYQAPCLKNFVEGNKTAAQIIYDAGQEFNINPQVLIVLVQKEVGLVTDTAPENWQYRTAGGYGCPDSTPGVCNTSYYGFTNQVRWAARMFNRIMTADPGWYTPYLVGQNSILWNPNTSCGRSNVVIQNRATQALYNYTPYRPNQAALNAGYGTGDGCSSYGNRNFFLYFNDWFGESYRGPLWRTVSSNDLYYVEDGKRFTVPSMDIVNQFGLTLKDVSFVSQAELDTLPLASNPFSSSLGYVIKASNDNALYIVNGGYKTPIRSMDQFTQFGFTSDDIKILPSITVAKLTLSQRNLSNYIQKWDGSVYKVESGAKRTIFELGMIDEGYTTPTPDAIIDRLPFAKALTSSDNYVVFGPSSGVRLYTPTGYHEILSMDAYDCWNIRTLPGFAVSSYDSVPQENKGIVYNCITKAEGESTWYLLNKGTKISLSSGQNTTGTPTSSSLLTSPSVITPSTIIKSSNSPELSLLSSNQKRAVPSLKVLIDLGYANTPVTTLNNASYNSLQYGARALSIGSVLLEPGGGISVVNTTSTRIQVVSPNQFDDYGFNWSALIPVNSADLSAFPSNGNLLQFVKTDTNDVYFMDGKVRYFVTSSLDSTLGINRNSLPTVSSKAFFETTLPWQMTAFIKANNDNAVYKIENGVKRPLASWNTYLRESGNRPQDLVILTSSAVSAFPQGSMIY